MNQPNELTGLPNAGLAEWVKMNCPQLTGPSLDEAVVQLQGLVPPGSRPVRSSEMETLAKLFLVQD
jgi:hypothetical protein